MAGMGAKQPWGELAGSGPSGFGLGSRESCRSRFEARSDFEGELQIKQVAISVQPGGVYSCGRVRRSRLRMPAAIPAVMRVIELHA
jgi:hypothetical protein